jgi:eukaryotic-like serine/threonine-protein kinase
MLTEGALVDERYRVGPMIGKGAMGVVYEGHDERIDRRVALKVLEASPSLGERHPQDRARFDREARAVARAGSSHVVDIYDFGLLPNGDAYMVLEYLEGENLRQRMETRGRLAPREMAEIVCQLLDGLERVHGAAIIHRDLKPSNVFLTRKADGSDFVKILDFGVCKLLGSSGEATAIGGVLGTVPYMAPEFVEHGPKNLDARADLYAVGVLLYRGVSGRLPYDTRNPAQLRIQMRERQAPALRDLVPDVDPAFVRIVERAMEWDPNARFQSAAELRDALLTWLGGQQRVDELLGAFLGRPQHQVRRSSSPNVKSKPNADTPPPRAAASKEEDETLDLASEPAETADRSRK